MTLQILVNFTYPFANLAYYYPALTSHNIILYLPPIILSCTYTTWHTIY